MFLSLAIGRKLQGSLRGARDSLAGESLFRGLPHMGPWSRRRRSGIADGTLEALGKAGPSSPRSSRRRIPYGLALLLVALGVGLAAALFLTIGSARADSQFDNLIERLDRLEAENRALRQEVDALKAERAGPEEPESETAARTPDVNTGRFVTIDPAYGYEILDPTSGINRKQRLILERRQDGTLAPNSVNLQGAVTAVANYQMSNRTEKFGYLMRHPTSTNQMGDEVSEATIHSAQLGFTATLGDWITGHAQILFDPEQSFGKGTNTDLARNQLQMRRAYVLFGNLDRSPFYAALGKTAVPFGLTDTVNPFTASTVWHAFGAMANGATVGYASDGLNVSIMAVQGGAQFRAANMPVHETAVPSKLNNLAVDANYTFKLGSTETLLLGGSHLLGSAYCQDYPITHFEPCRDNNPAFDVYGRLVADNLTLKAEFAQTLDAWPGSFNPGMPEFPASDVTSFDIGAKYRFDLGGDPLGISAEFSRFEAGPGGAPWEKQDQTVLGAAWFALPSVKLFAEYIRVAGFAPLNFISGGSIRDEDGNVMPDRTISDDSARSDVLLIGANAAF